jgi:hypothetical protein
MGLSSSNKSTYLAFSLPSGFVFKVTLLGLVIGIDCSFKDSIDLEKLIIRYTTYEYLSVY